MKHLILLLVCVSLCAMDTRKYKKPIIVCDLQLLAPPQDPEESAEIPTLDALKLFASSPLLSMKLGLNSAKIKEGYKGAALEVPQVGEILSDLKVALQTKKAEAGITVPLLGPVPTKNQIIASSMEETLLANADKKSMVERF